MRGLAVLILCLGFIVTIFSLQKFPPTLSEIDPRVNSPFVLTSFVHKLRPAAIASSFFWHRTPTIITGCLVLVLLYLVLKHLAPEMATPSTILLTVAPWFVSRSLFALPDQLVLALCLLAFWAYHKRRSLVLAGALIASCLVSWSGIALTIVFSSYLILKKEFKGWPIRLGLIASLVLVIGAIWSQFKLAYSLSAASIEVDTRVRQETAVNNYQDVIPLKIKRVAYNKYFFWYSRYVRNLFENLSWEKLASPSQQHVIVAKGFWSEKGIPQVFFWHLILGLIGLLAIKKASPLAPLLVITSIWGILDSAGTGLLLGIVLTAALGWQQLKYPLAKIATVALAVAGVVGTYHHFLSHEAVWRDNRPQAMYTMTTQAALHNQEQPLFVTTILGSTDWYYHWQHGSLPANITFDHFDLTSMPVIPGATYIGLPGEFLGNRFTKNQNDFSKSELPGHLTLVNEFPIRDHVSFGNGDFIWVVNAH